MKYALLKVLKNDYRLISWALGSNVKEKEGGKPDEWRYPLINSGENYNPNILKCDGQYSSEFILFNIKKDYPVGTIITGYEHYFEDGIPNSHIETIFHIYIFDYGKLILDRDGETKTYTLDDIPKDYQPSMDLWWNSVEKIFEYNKKYVSVVLYDKAEYSEPGDENYKNNSPCFKWFIHEVEFSEMREISTSMYNPTNLITDVLYYFFTEPNDENTPNRIKAKKYLAEIVNDFEIEIGIMDEDDEDADCYRDIYHYSWLDIKKEHEELNLKKDLTDMDEDDFFDVYGYYQDELKDLMEKHFK
jgi:hypothetical protein